MKEKIYLAALLHDIGKFYQRADDKKEDGNFRYLSPEYWQHPEYYCPEFNGRHSHKHVLWTAQFIEDQENVFKEVDKSLVQGENSLLRLATLHHSPGNQIYPQIIQLADHYSSASDRDNEPYSLEDGLADDDWMRFKKRRMVSVFEGIYNEDRTFQYKLPVTSLSLVKSDFFPRDDYSTDPDYGSLWKQFVEQFQNLPRKNTRVFAASLLALLEKFTVTIPSSTRQLPDVSLYDHAKTTASFAVNIFDYYQEQSQLPGTNDEPVLLLGADISGIQNFIYDIVSKNAAKNLKGRSFYLELMVESILQYLLKKLNLYDANVVYSSGGNFYVLAPNTSFIAKQLEEAERHLINQLFKYHRITLYVALASKPVSHELLLNKSNENLGTLWSGLIEEIDAKKNQRYANKLKDEYKAFFNPMEQGGESAERRDQITGEEIPEKKDRVEFEDGYISKYTKEQIDLGRELKQANYWVISHGEKHKFFKPNHGYEPLGLGIYHYFITKDTELRNIPEDTEIRNINDPNLITMAPGMDYISGFTFYGGNKYPTDDDGSPKTFDKLVGEGEFKRLGVLRMDVDNLGMIFMKGFSEGKRTFSRYSSLSRNLDYFFTGYLNKIQRQQAYDNQTYILYSGGDDLFILGKWDLLISMAKAIRQDFADWTCHNPELSLSGGIAMVGGKFPILKAAAEAGKEEETAKNYENRCLGKKNAFSLWKYPLSWVKNGEFEVVEDLKKRIYDLLEQEKLPKSFVGRISFFHNLWQRQTRENHNESWRWRMSYQLKRFRDQHKENEALASLIDEIKDDVFADTYKKQNHPLSYYYIELLKLAARWAELELRTNK